MSNRIALIHIVVVLVAGGWLFSRQFRLDGASSDGLPRLPVFLRFDRHRVVVVGGGTVAAAKIPALLAAGGNVTVIATSRNGRSTGAATCRSTLRPVARSSS